jgi:predicted GIY-YIG superfamily endonuclease
MGYNLVMTSVYWIRHQDHTDIFTQGYIGITNNFDKRMSTHKTKPCNTYFKNAINKYGWENLIKEVILIADKTYCLMVEEKLRNLNNIGWNIAIGGGVPPVPLKKHGIEMRKKISEINKIRLQDPIYRKKFTKARLGLTSWNKGKKASPETIEKLRLSHIGKPSGKKGKIVSQESINKLKETFKANPWTCPHCNKMGFNKGSGNRWHFDNCKDKA